MNVVPTLQSALYVVLTPMAPDSGLVFGSIWAVAEAAAARLLTGPEARGALVAAYVRLADALVPVGVETTVLPGGGGAARVRVRTWLERQLLGQYELEMPPKAH